MDMDRMTERQLDEAANRYDDRHNEGGYGFNPYRAEIERRELSKTDTEPVSLAELDRSWPKRR